MQMKKYFFLTVCLTLMCSLAQANLVQVMKLKGRATQLGPNMREAKDVELHAWYPKDTSIVTYERSFVLLSYKNGGNLTVGPNSKIVVDMTPEKNQEFVALLTGKIKASVTPDKERKNKDSKLIIKTTTAALGVRGTAFQTTYNPESKITSLITFHGQVALAKVDEHKPVAKIEETLQKKAVEVNKGEYSGVSANLAVATEPVKIAPEQFTKLKLNETLGATEEKIDETKFKAELKKDVEELAKESKQEAAPKKWGTFDAKSGSYTPRPGGLVDIESGLYVPPARDAEFDSKLKIYKVSSAMGTVKDDGTYQPPEGLKLEAGKGFVVDEAAVSVKSEQKTEVAKLAQELNQTVAGQIATPAPRPRKKPTLDGLDENAYERYFNKEDL